MIAMGGIRLTPRTCIRAVMSVERVVKMMLTDRYMKLTERAPTDFRGRHNARRRYNAKLGSVFGRT